MCEKSTSSFATFLDTYEGGKKPSPASGGYALPPMDEELRWILGRPNFVCAPIAHRLRAMGQEIEKRSEPEQAAVIYWMVDLYLKHGESWRKEGDRILREA